MTDLIALARRHKHVAPTHYEGCEADHIGCLVNKLADEVERQRAEIERLKQEPELLRAELISLTNAARKALADAYNRARETRDAFIEWRDVR